MAKSRGLSVTKMNVKETFNYHNLKGGFIMMHTFLHRDFGLARTDPEFQIILEIIGVIRKSDNCDSKGYVFFDSNDELYLVMSINYLVENIGFSNKTAIKSLNTLQDLGFVHLEKEQRRPTKIFLTNKFSAIMRGESSEDMATRDAEAIKGMNNNNTVTTISDPFFEEVSRKAPKSKTVPQSKEVKDRKAKEQWIRNGIDTMELTRLYGSLLMERDSQSYKRLPKGWEEPTAKRLTVLIDCYPDKTKDEIAHIVRYVVFGKSLYNGRRTTLANSLTDKAIHINVESAEKWEGDVNVACSESNSVYSKKKAGEVSF